MAHYAFIENGVVTQVIVADQDVIESGLFGDPACWVQTSYNTRGGVYHTPNTTIPDPDQSKAFRKNFARPNYLWDAVRDAFIPPQPFQSWVLNQTTCLWEPPIQRPVDGKRYRWDELVLDWVEVKEEK